MGDSSTSVEAIDVEAISIDSTGTLPALTAARDAPHGGAAVELLAVVADPVRWRLLAHLADGHTSCVCHLRPVAAVAGNLLSYHLLVLRDAGLVSATRRGRWVDYTIRPDALDRLHAALPAAVGSRTAA